MPAFDGTGPLGYGPRTGRGLGPCGAGLAYRRGYGYGRSYGYGYGYGRRWGGYPVSPNPLYNQPLSKEQEKDYLENEKKGLEDNLKDIETRLKELEK